MAHNCHGNPKELTAKPKGFWFCRELFGFVVTVVGQNTNRGKTLCDLPTCWCVNYVS